MDPMLDVLDVPNVPDVPDAFDMLTVYQNGAHSPDHSLCTSGGVSHPQTKPIVPAKITKRPRSNDDCKSEKKAKSEWIRLITEATSLSKEEIARAHRALNLRARCDMVTAQKRAQEETTSENAVERRCRAYVKAKAKATKAENKASAELDAAEMIALQQAPLLLQAQIDAKLETETQNAIDVYLEEIVDKQIRDFAFAYHESERTLHPVFYNDKINVLIALIRDCCSADYTVCATEAKLSLVEQSYALNSPVRENASRVNRASIADRALAIAKLESLIFNDEQLDTDLKGGEYALSLAYIKTLVELSLYRDQTARTAPKTLRVLSDAESQQHRANEESEDTNVLANLEGAFGSRADNEKGHEIALTAQIRARGVTKNEKIKDTVYAKAAAGKCRKTKVGESEGDDDDVGDEQELQERDELKTVIVLPQQMSTCTTCACKADSMFECNGVEICSRCEQTGDANCGLCISFKRCRAPVCDKCSPGEEVLCAMCTQTENPLIERCTNCNHTVRVKDNKLFACDNNACGEHEFCYQCVLNMNNEIDMTAKELRGAPVPCSNEEK
jgi:hypothetical protein